MKGSYKRFYDGIGALVSGATTYEFVLGQLGAAPSGPTRTSRAGS